MNHLIKTVVISLLFFSAGFHLTAEPCVNVSLDRDSAIYQKGEKITFSGEVSDNGKPVPGQKLKYILYKDGGIADEKSFESSDKPETVSVALEHPGWVKFECFLVDNEGKKIKGKQAASMIGAMVAPDEIRIARKEPADFDVFWDAVKKELSAVPMKATRKDVPVSNNQKDKVRCYDVKVDCAGGMPVSGYLCMPAGNVTAKSLPAVVCFQGAGVWPANKMFGGADRRINFEINAHGIENGKDRAWYDALPLGGYMFRGKTDRNAMYYKGVVMRLLRALEYVKSLPEWNGKTLVVGGFSQGGAQALWAAGLDKDVTLCIATCPALCDLGGTEAVPVRSSGWPGYYDWRKKNAETEKIADAVSYYDCAFFARRIKAKTYIGTGFADSVCPPSSVYAAYNELKSKSKFMENAPRAGHNGSINPSAWRRVDFIVNSGRKN